MTPAQNEELVGRLVEEAVNGCDLGVLDEVATGEIAAQARRWVGPFGESSEGARATRPSGWQLGL